MVVAIEYPRADAHDHDGDVASTIEGQELAAKDSNDNRKIQSLQLLYYPAVEVVAELVVQSLSETGETDPLSERDIALLTSDDNKAADAAIHEPARLEEEGQEDDDEGGVCRVIDRGDRGREKHGCCEQLDEFCHDGDGHEDLRE